MIITLTSSCTGEDVLSDTGLITVGILAENGYTRTTMLPNGLSSCWEDGDEIAVWASNSSGSYALEAQKFTAYGLDGGYGFFTSILESEMPFEQYAYYACYPYPQTYNGTFATFNIPDFQDGKVADGADVMIANPIQYGPLTPLPDPEDHFGMSLQMNHMLHQFRFYIPETSSIGQNQISKLELTFPKPVAGKLTYNLADPTEPAFQVLDKNKITLLLTTPLDVAKESEDIYDYACVAFAPTSFEPGESLKIRAFTEDKIAVIDPIDLRARTFEAGHSTPVCLLVKEFIDFPYVITFTLDGNYVGEKVTSIQFSAPEGCAWPQTGTNIYTHIPEKGEMSVGESITFRYSDYDDFAKFSGAEITLVLETENTIYTTTANIGTIPAGVESHTSHISASVPYLLYQDFSAIPSFSDEHDSPKVGAGSDTYTGVTELSSVGLIDWYGTRIGIQDGTSARICCRYEHVLLSGGYYKGRLYSPPLSRIKEGKDVKISVTFDHGSNREEMKTLINWSYKAPDKSPMLYFGINTQDVVTNPDQNEGDIIDQVTGLYAGSGYASATPSSLSPMEIKGEALDKENGSYTNLPRTRTVMIENVDRDMRLGWILSTDNNTSNINSNYWFYIDNIKVQISK